MNKREPTDKKLWRKPELIVLVRSHPEETVLTVCKNASSAGPLNKNKCNRGPSGCMVISNS
jgi:hypothetical protein